MATVDRLYPQNKISNYDGAWIKNGSATEMFGEVTAIACDYSFAEL